MLKIFHRTQRVSQQLQKEISTILQYKMRDPRLNILTMTISSTQISRDMAYAKVFVTFLDDDDALVKNNLQILKKASGYIRKLLAKTMYLRMIPILNFLHDRTAIQGRYIHHIISNIKKNELSFQDQQ